jgi:salicylate hydroxylase
MERPGARQIIVAGGGIAGLTAALAFARRGFAVQLYERATRLDEVGAGLQLSPNAVHLLAELGVVDRLASVAVRPDHVTLIDARTLATLAVVRLGDFAERRWGAPYLVAHRADLQSALVARARQEPEISLVTGAAVSDFAVHRRGVTASIDRDGKVVEATARLLVAADGVWSPLRALAGEKGRSRFSGSIAWRATMRSDGPAATLLGKIAGRNSVTVLVDPAFHLIVYPLRAGNTLNLVAVTSGQSPGEGWASQADTSALARAAASSASEVRGLFEQVGSWTIWPINTVEFSPWTLSGAFALIGDAAHAMTPFAAQGAAMAIEDAVTLADTVAGAAENDADALARWEAARRARIARVVRRGALNRFAWHAAGPVALARNLVLRLRSPESLAADLDWLFGWRRPDQAQLKSLSE